MDSPLELLLNLLTAAGLAGLIGLEREIRIFREERIEETAGLRTFAMIGALGFASVHLATITGWPWIATLLLVGVLGFSLVSHGFRAFRSKEFGITSELAALASFGVGIFVGEKEVFLALILSVLFTGLLALKTYLHSVAYRISPQELLAILKFLIISFIVLQILPVEWTDPWGFFNWRPYVVWLMVVLVAAIRFGGYFLAKFIKSTHSIVLSGIVGGLVSSTAVTTGLAQESRGQKEITPFFMAILIATGIMFFRVILEISLLSRELLERLIWPLFAMGIAALFFASVFLWNYRSRSFKSAIKIQQPLDLKAALLFGLFFLAIIFISEKLQSSGLLGDLGLLATGAVSGLTDVDAITLAMSNLAKNGEISIPLAAQVILVAVLVNTIVKVGIILAFGSRKLLWHILWALPLLMALGILVFLFP